MHMFSPLLHSEERKQTERTETVTGTQRRGLGTIQTMFSAVRKGSTAHFGLDGPCYAPTGLIIGTEIRTVVFNEELLIRDQWF